MTENIIEIKKYFKEIACEFGADNSNSLSPSYVERNNTKPDALKDNGGYFGFVHQDEDPSGPFHDFGVWIFPNDKDKPWLLCIGVGSLGYKNDYEIASRPGIRRLLSKIISSEGFLKTDLTNIESSLPKTITANQKLQHIKKTLKSYSKVIHACEILDDPLSEISKSKIASFLAVYAKIRDWPTNNTQRNAVTKALLASFSSQKHDIIEVLKELLLKRKYIVLEGAPGTGKTRMARLLSEDLGAKLYFTQFHAETSYSDFVFGIRPDLENNELSYIFKEGIFHKALSAALADSSRPVCLIIDEINRANLSNVLGPAFYLFEYNRNEKQFEVEISEKLTLDALPENLYVIATMNTADRSLAVVDFALRRRFAWFKMKPECISSRSFHKKDFNAMQEIFYMYASNSEIDLQPGQAYFIAENDDDMKLRIEYELLPLIKEYLQEGLLASATEELNTYFLGRINKSLFD